MTSNRLPGSAPVTWYCAWDGTRLRVASSLRPVGGRTCPKCRRRLTLLTGEAGIIPILAIIAAAGAGLVIDQLINNGEVGATLFNAFFTAIQGLADAVFKVIGSMIDALPDAADLGIDIPDGFVVGYSFLNTFLPLSEALTIAGTALAGYVALFGWRLAVMVYHLIPKPLMGT